MCRSVICTEACHEKLDLRQFGSTSMAEAGATATKPIYVSESDAAADSRLVVPLQAYFLDNEIGKILRIATLQGEVPHGGRKARDFCVIEPYGKNTF